MEQRRVTVVGAGFSGLVSAFYLQRAGFSVEVVEERERAGGLISTTRTSFGLVESAANGFLNSALVEDIFSELGLQLVPTMREARRRYIFRGGRPRRWPLSLLGSLRFFLFILSFVFWRSRIGPREGETVRVWARRAMGVDAAQYLIEAFLQGIYAGDPGRMSARLLFGRFFTPARKGETATNRRPKIRGTVSCEEGMGQFIERLRSYLTERGVTFRMAEKMPAFKAEPAWPTVIATSSSSAGELLQQIDPLRAEACRSVELVPVITASISFSEGCESAKGFGCLFPPVENRRALGVLLNNYIFPNRSSNGFMETWILGGARANRDELMALSDQAIVQTADEERRLCLGGQGKVIDCKITRWPAALPHYTRELEASLGEMSGMRKNLILIGNYLGDIGLARILERAERLPREVSATGEWRI
jgi:protoporphyrinogen/coproporphyrinogen III oxidase